MSVLDLPGKRAALENQLQAPQALSQGLGTTLLGTSVTPCGTRLGLCSPSPPQLCRLPTLLVLRRCLLEEAHFSTQRFPYFLPLQRLPPVPRDSEAFRQRWREQLELELRQDVSGHSASSAPGSGLQPPAPAGTPLCRETGWHQLQDPPSPHPPQTPAALLGSQGAAFTLMIQLPGTAPFSALTSTALRHATASPFFSSERNIFSLESKHSHEAQHS